MNVAELEEQKTSERFVSLEKFEKELDSGKFPEDPQPYVDVLLQNMQDSNFRIIEFSLDCIRKLFEHSPDSLRQISSGLFAEAISEFKNLREEVKASATELALKTSQFLDEELIIQSCESNLISKNAGQKQYTLILLENLIQEEKISNVAKIEKFTQKLTSDASGDVREEAEELLELCGTGIARDDAEASKMGKTEQLHKSESAILSKTQPQEMAKSIVETKKYSNQNSLFPPPENDDNEAESETFGIVPPETGSYYSYKPIYCYDLPENCESIISSLTDVNVFLSGKSETIRACIDKIFNLIAKSTDWTQQMTGIHSLISVVILYMQQSDDKNIYLAEQIQESALLYIQDLSAVITSRRSVLEREICISLELAFQRFGKVLQRLGDALIDTLLQLITMTGVYTENEADSLLKTIIVHSGSKSQLSKLIAGAKSTKNSNLKAHCIDYFCLFMVYNELNQKIEFWQTEQEFEQLINKFAEDPSQKVRQAGKAFICVANFFNPQFASNLLQTNNNMQKIATPQAGFYTYESLVALSVDDESFPGYFLQSGCCHSEVIPISYELEKWRQDLITADLFVMRYQDLSDEGNIQYVEGVKTSLILNQSNKSSPTVKQSGTKKFVPSIELEIEDFNDDMKQNSLMPKTAKFSSKSSYQSLSPMTNQSSVFSNEKPQKSVKIMQDLDEDDEIETMVKNIVRKNSRQDPKRPEPEDECFSQTAIHLKDIISEQRQEPSDNERVQQVISEMTINPESMEQNIDRIAPLLSAQIECETLKSLIVILLDCCSVQDERLQQKTLKMLISIEELQPSAFDSLIDFTVPIFVSVFRSQYLAVRKLANALLVQLCESGDFQQLFETFSLILKQETDVMADAALRFLALVGRRCKSAQLLKQLFDDAVYDVIALFSAESAAIRKSAISCFIDYYLLLGDEDFTYFELLDSYQLRLVVERLKKVKE